MAKKLGPASRKGFTKLSLIACFTSVFLPQASSAADPQLVETKRNLQAIYQRMQQKYAAHAAAQAAKAQEAERQAPAPSSIETRQYFDEPVSRVTNSRPYPDFSDDSDSRFAPGEELILSLSANGTELTSIFATKSERGLQIGFGDLTQILEFGIDLNLTQVSAEGWFFKQNNHFSLRQLSDNRLEISTNRNKFHLSPDDYQVGDDLYVELDDFVKWFGLEFHLYEEQLKLAITSNQTFPLEARKSRQRQKIHAGSNQSVMPITDSGYQAFSPPMLDIQLSAQEANHVFPAPVSAPDSGPRETRTSSASYSVLASHDLAYLNAELFLAGNDDDSLNSAWLTLSRQSDRADLLGPLYATEYAFGDVVPVNAGLGMTQAMSRGFSLNNTPLTQLADNRRVNITGEIQVGWDIELYRNGVLLAQLFNVSDGRYEFNDMELEFGANDFELLFYGPQGQIESRTETYLVDGNTVRGGEGNYRFSLVEVGESVFNMDSFSDDPRKRGLLGSTVLDVGITDWLALSFGSAIFEPKLGDTSEFYSLGANASLGRYGLFSARYLLDVDLRQSADFLYRTRAFNTSYNFGFRRTESLLDTAIPDQYTDQYTASMSGSLFRGSRTPISYQNSWQRIDRDTGLTSQQAQNILGLGTPFGYLTHNINWEKGLIEFDPFNPNVDSNNEYLYGGLQYRKGFGRVHTRLFGNYSIRPVKQTESYGGALNINWTNNFNSELRYSRFVRDDYYQLNLGLNWRKDAFTLSTNAGYKEDGSWYAGLGLRFSIGYEPQQGSLFTSGRPIAQSGGASVRVFEDLNMNQRWDEGEPLIEGAKVKAVQAFREAETNKSGVAVISSLYNNTLTDIVVDQTSLDGPYMITTIPGKAIKARKGYIEQVELPVVKAGELEGIIYLHNDKGEAEVAPYVAVKLVDQNNKVVAATRSEFDGYYLFTEVKPGRYQVKIDQAYLDRRELKPTDKHVEFSHQGDIIEGMDFVLKPLEQATGYVAAAGYFDTAEMLKLYYHILRKRAGEHFVQTPFYIRQPGQSSQKDGYILGLAYFPGQQLLGSEAEKQAHQACANLVQQQIRCDVQYHDFKY
jgi:hypothetical protein